MDVSGNRVGQKKRRDSARRPPYGRFFRLRGECLETRCLLSVNPVTGLNADYSIVPQSGPIAIPAVFGTTVLGRRLFYNESGTASPQRYDGDNAAINANDDNAIATDKVAYLPNDPGAATFANVSSYSKGINGIMVDLSGSGHSSITAADFVFKIGNNNSPETWQTAPAPTAVFVRSGAGTSGSDRVEILWADGAIQKSWLEVIVRANGNTGLSQGPGWPAGYGDVFFFGNVVGDSGAGDTAVNATVNSIDEAGARNNPQVVENNIPITNIYDFNRDARVNSVDEAICRLNATTSADVVKYLYGIGGLVEPSLAPPDLDADSNNDGQIADNDDAIEDQSPGQLIDASADGQGELAPLMIQPIANFVSGGLTLHYDAALLTIYAQSDRTSLIANGAHVSPGTTVYAEGLAVGSSTVTLNYTVSATTVTDSVVLTIPMNLQIDSNNDEVIDASDDAIAGVPGLPGKIIMVDNGDSDGNGIPDFADGYTLPAAITNQFATNGIDPADTSEDAVPMAFTPLRLSIAQSIDLSTARLRFVYSGSDPAGVTFHGIEFQPAPGHLRIWTKDGFELRTSATVNATVDAGDFVPTAASETDSSGDITPAQLGITGTNRTITLYVEGIAESAAPGSDPIELVFVQAPSSATKQKSIPNSTAADAGLQIGKVEDVKASDQFNASTTFLDATDHNAWIPLNDDDDDNDGTSDNQAASLSPVENDLLRVALYGPKDDAGTAQLLIASNLRVWQKTGADYTRVISRTTTASGTPLQLLSANGQMDLFVEATSWTSTRQKGDITVYWKSNGSPTFKRGAADTIHVFKIEGPRNVPDFAEYDYKATGGQPGTAKSQFVSENPRGGEQQNNQQGQTTDTQSVLWTEGATFGKIRYKAAPNFIWAFDVAIVKVELTTGNFQLAPAATNGPVQVVDSNGVPTGRIDSTTGRSQGTDRTVAYNNQLPAEHQALDTPAMTATISISKMEGPVRNSVMFGVSHIQVGLIQSVSFFYRAKYTGNVIDPIVPVNATMLDLITKKPKPGVTYNDTVVGGNLFDPVERKRPWYDPTGVTGGGATGMFQSETDTLVENQLLKIADTPFHNGRILPALNGLTLIGYDFVWGFTDYVAVRTTDANNGADNIYTQRAVGTWRLDLTGSLIGGTNVQFGTYQRTGNGVAVVNQFQFIGDGTRVPDNVVGDNVAIVNDTLEALPGL